MEPNGVGMFSNMTSSGMLGLEMSLHHPHNHIPPQNPQNPNRHQPPATHPHPHHQQMMAFGNPEAERRQQPPQQSAKQPQSNYPFATKSKPLTISDEDEPNPTTEDSGGDGKRKGSPWQRMKWTDNMVRLLIMVVFYIGDEVGSDQVGPDPCGKKKGAGVLQKKGKWKSVSRAMMERGFSVSPQQCEDKFNDLNKRYKRVNDILGKGTSCKVVENQSLLETMDHLSPKMKDEVKKLLNSKHLFFREMCAYHNSCGGNGSSGGGVHPSPPEVQAEPSHNQQQRCSHANDKNAPVSSREETDISRMDDDDDDNDEDDDNHDDDDMDEDDDDDEVEMVRRENGHNNDDEGVLLVRSSRKRQRNEMAMTQQFNNEVICVVEDVSKSLWEKRQWMKTRLMQLEERRVGFEGQAYELEKQRLKWLKFSWKKEREMEGEKLKNERMKLENERMVLILRQKEIELLDL